jgi:hypothetical protein
MSEYNKYQKTIYVTMENEYIADAVREETRTTGKGFGFLLLEAYAVKNKLKVPEHKTKADRSRERAK